MSRLAYYVRHGAYQEVIENGKTQDHLTSEGKKQALAAGQNLKNIGITSKVIIISSTKQRTIETAEIIRDALNASTVFLSPLLATAGEQPGTIASMLEITNQVLHENDIEYEGQLFVFVAHQPLAFAISGQNIATGDVINFDIDTWVNLPD